jgi:hypothetical protein
MTRSYAHEPTLTTDVEDADADGSTSRPSGPGRIVDSSDRLLRWLLGLTAVAFVAITLGPSLVGARVFLGLDVLYRFAPWASLPGPHLSGQTIYISDTVDWSIPALHQIADRLWNGDYASWSSLPGGGSPLLANPDFGVFSPGRWLFLILPTWFAPGWSKLLETAFASVFSYLLVRRLKGSKVAAGVAAIIYPVTGFMIGWTNWPQVAVACVIPMMFWSVERFVQLRTVRSAVPIALASALLLFGGFPAVAGQTFYLAAAFLLVRTIVLHHRELKQCLRDIAIAACAAALGIGLTAFQLLPFAHQLLSDTDLTYRDQGFFTNTPIRFMLSSVFPRTFSGNFVVNWASPQDVNAYVGAVVVLLAALGLTRILTHRAYRSVGIYFLAVVAFVVVLVWFQGPWTDWLDHFPVFHGNPIGRIRSQLGLPAAVLAAAGIDVLRDAIAERRADTRERSVSRVLVLVIPALVTVAIAIVGIKIARTRYIGMATSKWPDVLVAVIPLCLITALIWMSRRWRVAGVGALGVAIVAIGVQAVAATSFFWPTSPKSEFYPSTSGIRYLQKNVGDERIASLGYALRPNVQAYFGLPSINGHTFYPQPMQKLIRKIYPGSFQSSTYSILSADPQQWFTSPGLDRLGVRYLVGSPNSAEPGTVSTPVPIPGDVEPIAATAGSFEAQPGTTYRATVPAGALRGVNVPMATTVLTKVTATLKTATGAVVAQDSIDVAPGNWTVPIPLAAEAPGAAPTGPTTVEVTVDQPATATKTAGGDLRVQAVRPPATSDGARLVYASSGLVIWQRLTALPRIRWASHATVVQDDASRLAAAAQGPRDPDGVILADAPAHQLGTASVAPTQLDVQQGKGDTLKVRVNVKTAGYLVVADNVQDDFSASVDGKHEAVVPADYAVGAVYVPAGTHEIRFDYAPRGRSVGFVISGFSAVVLIAAALPVAWWGRLRRRRRVEVEQAASD